MVQEHKEGNPWVDWQQQPLLNTTTGHRHPLVRADTMEEDEAWVGFFVGSFIISLRV